MKVGGGWLTSPNTQAVFDVYAAHGFDLFAVGGCVRNSLLGEPVSDIDMSSNAHPATATDFLTSAGFKVIPTGIDHGTITVISNATPYEITTFRKDVETDGRRAVVTFADSIDDDAQRRDFTINALYSDRNGHVFDPVGGLKDIANHRVRFIGVGADRIREDYLRTLRFFRFHARYADPMGGFDPEALAAISGNLDGLANLSRERVGAEMLKLLAARNPGPAVMTMAQTGVLNALLPGTDPKALPPLIHVEAALGFHPDPICRLASFADKDSAETLRLSKAQLRQLSDLRDAATGPASPRELGFRLKQDRGLCALALRSALLETPLAPGARDHIIHGAAAIFPIKAADLPTELAGRDIGKTLRKLEAQWIASDFALTKSQLLG